MPIHFSDPSFRPRRAVLAACVAVAGVALAGCAAMAPKTPEQAVTVRAQARWDAMRADKFEKSYEYTAPTYRALKPFDSYRSQYGKASFWTDAKVFKVECSSATSCVATISISVRNMTPIRPPNVLTTALHENWVLQQGSWYLLPSL